MDDLKACPFCGGHGEIVRDRFSDVEWAYCCHSCELIGPTGKDEDHARRAWNTRADDAEVLRLRAEVERLTEALLGVIPDSNNPKDLCWCPSYRDVRANGHSLKCVAARAALKEKPE